MTKSSKEPEHYHAYGKDACPHPHCSEPSTAQRIVGLRAALRAISETADSRRHYSPDEQYQALGDIRTLADEALRQYPAK